MCRRSLPSTGRDTVADGGQMETGPKKKHCFTQIDAWVQKGTEAKNKMTKKEIMIEDYYETFRDVLARQR